MLEKKEARHLKVHTYSIYTRKWSKHIYGVKSR